MFIQSSSALPSAHRSAMKTSASQSSIAASAPRRVVVALCMGIVALALCSIVAAAQPPAAPAAHRSSAVRPLQWQLPRRRPGPPCPHHGCARPSAAGRFALVPLLLDQAERARGQHSNSSPEWAAPPPSTPAISPSTPARSRSGWARATNSPAPQTSLSASGISSQPPSMAASFHLYATDSPPHRAPWSLAASARLLQMAPTAGAGNRARTPLRRADRLLHPAAPRALRQRIPSALHRAPGLLHHPVRGRLQALAHPDARPGRLPRPAGPSHHAHLARSVLARRGHHASAGWPVAHPVRRQRVDLLRWSGPCARPPRSTPTAHTSVSDRV